MKLSLDWLGEWIDLPPDSELVDRLDMCGFEDSLVESTGPDLSEIRVGLVVEREQHPNADRLSLCRVDLGEEELREIVCGAPNVAAGQKVAVAVPGMLLPDGTKLKKSKIRGVTSLGMICSTRELGLGEEHDGILVLGTDAAPGTALPEVLPGAGRVLEVGITPNRGDTASLLGVAREVRALFEREIRPPETAPDEVGETSESAVQVSIDAPERCHHYVGRVVRGVKIGPSPDWVVERLEASGLRAINCVVDVTNLVLLEFGQPLHAFDLAKLRGAEVRVRSAASGEKIVTLDGESRELDPEDLVIADAERAIAIAGVMGGADSEVTDTTTDVLIESAHFHPTAVRLAARRQGLRTEASYRFERGIDPEGVRRAADRCARLLAELAGGRVAPGAAEARGEPHAATREIRLEVERANRLLGTGLSRDEMASLLERVGVEARAEGADALIGRVPSHRNDLHVHQDLTEEVARIYGYDRIPVTEPSGLLRPVELPSSRALAERMRDALVAAGLVETVSFPFIAPADMAALRLPADDPRHRTVEVLNPIKEEEGRLRSHLLPSLLRVLHQNLARQADEVAIFELARPFIPRGAEQLPDEPLGAVCAWASTGSARLWGGDPAPLFFRAKGVAESLLKQMGYVATLRPQDTPPYLHPGASAAIVVGGRVSGAVGELHPEVAGHFDIEVPCAVLEIDLEALGARRPESVRYREVSRFPQVRRDLAVLVDRTTPAGELLGAVRKAAGRDCISVEIFDRYHGKGVPADRVSLAFRLVFQRGDRTLTDAEVAPAVDKVVKMLSKRFGGELR